LSSSKDSLFSWTAHAKLSKAIFGLLKALKNLVGVYKFSQEWKAAKLKTKEQMNIRLETMS
jgi:hypothetical protein